MCNSYNIDNDLALLCDARETADALICEFLDVPITKAIDLSDPDGFDRTVATLASKLRNATKANDAAAVREVFQVLDVDWQNSTAVQRARLIRDAVAAAAKATKKIPKKISTVFEPAADELVQATRNHARQVQSLSIAADFNALDRRIAKHLKTSQAAFVRNEYGRRLEQFSGKARDIVASGLESGLGRDDIAHDLEQAAQAALVNKSPYYWELVAGAFMANGRSYAQMSSYAEAGIKRYVIEAVLDEHTTEICRYLHGKSFSVQSALERFERIESMDKPENIKSIHPWVREAFYADTGQKTLFVRRGPERIPIAEVTRSGFGNRDDLGEFRSKLSEKEMNDLGIGFPPFHGLCRTTTLAVS